MAIEWDDFVRGEFEKATGHTIALDFEILKNAAVSSVTVINRALFRKAINAGCKGLAISICDYTREAIAFSFGAAIADSLDNTNRLPCDTSSWEKGDILSLGNFSFEFVGMSTSDSFGPMIEYVATDSTKTSQALSFVPRAIHKCVAGAKATTKRKGKFRDGIAQCKKMGFAEARLYDTLTLIDKPIAYVTSASTFLNVPPTKLRSAKVTVDGEKIPLTSCLKTAYINSDGKVNEYCDYPVEGNPAIVTPCRNEEGIGDLFYVLEYIEDGNDLDAVVIEAPEIEAIEGVYSHLEDIIGHGVPVVVFCDERTLHEANGFESLGLAQFAWNRETLRELEKASASTSLSLTKRERSFVDRNAQLRVAEDSVGLSEVASVLYSLNDGRDSMTDHGKQALNSLNRLLGTALRQTEIVLSDVSLERKNIIDTAEKVLTSDSIDCSLTNIEVSRLKACNDILRSLFQPNRALPKEEVAYEAISHSLECKHSVCLVASNAVSAREAKDYWTGVFEEEGLQADRISVLTPREFMKQDWTKNSVDVLVCGWFTRETMEKIVLTGLSSVYSVLFYKGKECELETDWYRKASAFWKDKSKIARKMSSRFLKSIGIKPALTFATKESEATANASSEAPRYIDDSISFIVERMDADRAERERAGDNEEACLARPVYFTDGSHRWLRVPDSAAQLGGDKLVVLEDFEKDVFFYTKKTAAALHEGDIVLKTDSDDDALDELSKASFGSYERAMEVALRWRKPIDEAKQRIGEEAIRDKIKRAGSKKTDQTIQSWIRGGRVIAPGKKRDIVAISNAFDNYFTEEEIERIIGAIRIVKGVRINTGRSIASSIADAFISDVALYGAQEALAGFASRHDFGTVELLYVEHVGHAQMVGLNKFGYYID